MKNKTQVISFQGIHSNILCHFCKWLIELGACATLDSDGILTNATPEQIVEVTRGYALYIPA